MIAIRQASMPEDHGAVQELFAEYLRWASSRVYEEYGPVFDPESMIVHDMETIDIFMPPQGLLLLAFQDRSLAGCACMRHIGDEIAELKRMYVRPSFRRQGIGRLLVNESLNAVRELGYQILRLDSAGFMSEAHALYRSVGFRDRPPYGESEVPPEYRKHWVFMELRLADSGVGP
jgi:GNAT superfamily N-acetyltransferase